MQAAVKTHLTVRKESLIVKGHSGSTAQTYAKAKGYTFQSIDNCDHSSTHEVITLEPTCTTAGTTTQVCDNCGFVVSETQLPAKGHSYETVNTENNNGHTYDYQKCSACNDEKTVITHNAFVEGYYDYKTTATCTKAGIETKTCKVEGCNKVEVKAVPSTGHTIEKSTVTKQPTCTQAGEEKGVCSVCNTEVTQTIPALGHTFQIIKKRLIIQQQTAIPILLKHAQYAVKNSRHQPMLNGLRGSINHLY